MLPLLLLAANAAAFAVMRHAAVAAADCNDFQSQADCAAQQGRCYWRYYCANRRCYYSCWAEIIEIAGGVEMPYVANGLIGAIHGQPASAYQAAVDAWLSLGGRGLDTALEYQDQAKVGSALLHNNASVPRGDVFLITKIPCDTATKNATTEAAGLDEGLLSFALSNLLYIENPYSHKKCR
jgi:hypothetical protein